MFLTKEIEKQLPDYNEYKAGYPIKPDTKVPLKFFNPTGAATWYIVAYDRAHQIFYGYADLFGDGQGEWGEMTREELEFTPVRMGLMIERDCHWQTKTVAELEAAGRVRAFA